MFNLAVFAIFIALNMGFIKYQTDHNKEAEKETLTIFNTTLKEVLAGTNVDPNSITIRFMNNKELKKYTYDNGGYRIFTMEIDSIIIHPLIRAQDKASAAAWAAVAMKKAPRPLTPEKLEEIFVAEVRQALEYFDVPHADAYSIKRMNKKEEEKALQKKETYSAAYISGNTIYFLGGQEGAKRSCHDHIVGIAAHESGHAADKNISSATTFESEKYAEQAAAEYLCATGRKYIIENKITNLEKDDPELKLWSGAVTIKDQIKWLKEALHCKECLNKNANNQKPLSFNEEFVEVICKKGLQESFENYNSKTKIISYIEYKKLLTQLKTCQEAEQKNSGHNK
jgi:hypothetical protein